jgi:hypothetical protein
MSDDRRPDEQDQELAKTSKLDQRMWSGMPSLGHMLSGLIPNSPTHYIQVPSNVTWRDLKGRTKCWRIELHDLAPGVDPIGFAIAGDTVIGRGASSDIDLEPYSGHKAGVSRRHVLLRPAGNRLYIIDLGSTNGTMINSIVLTRSQARLLESDDLITLGKFSFTVKLVNLVDIVLEPEPLDSSDETAILDVGETPSTFVIRHDDKEKDSAE